MRFIRSNLFNLELSALAFGAASVLGRYGRRDSLIALGAAYDAGVNVFDTARSYGYGESETLLGEFLKGRRTKVIISSKFGILPAKQSSWKNTVKPIARAAIQAMPMLAKKIRGQLAAEFHPGQFTVEILKASVETSLRKLSTDYLDILFMHEPTLQAVKNEDLVNAMQRLVDAGKVRAIGVSALPEIAAISMERPAIKAIQFACNIGNGFASQLPESAADKAAFRMASQPFGGVQGAEAIKAKFADTAEFGAQLPPALREKLLTADRRSLLTNVVLNSALIGNDVVLTSMMNPRHTQMNAAALSSSLFLPEEIYSLRAWLLEDRVG